MAKFIKHKFHIQYPLEKSTTMYTHLKDGKHAMTYIHNDQITTTYISIDEYASALMTYILISKNLPS